MVSAQETTTAKYIHSQGCTQTNKEPITVDPPFFCLSCLIFHVRRKSL